MMAAKLLCVAILLVVRESCASEDVFDVGDNEDTRKACSTSRPHFLSARSGNLYSGNLYGYGYGNLYSPGFLSAQDYPEGVFCSWIVMAPPDTVILLDASVPRVGD